MSIRTIDICIATRKRPEGLKRLLVGINSLAFEKVKVDLHIIVVDNDCDQGVKKICAQCEKGINWKITYVCEEIIGISYARNTALKHCRTEAEFVAFIDDDEVPDKNWLEELLTLLSDHNADIVTGPIIPSFSQSPPSWAIKGKFYERRRYLNGHKMNAARTGNVLVKHEIIKNYFSKMGSVFDERLALRGGSDTLLFKRLSNLGYKIIWADTAMVYESVPVSRVSVGWVIKRSMRIAQTHLFVDQLLGSSASVKVKGFFGGVGRVFIGLFLVIFSIIPAGLFGFHYLVKALRIFFRGIGLLTGLFNVWYQEYEQIHDV